MSEAPVSRQALRLRTRDALLAAGIAGGNVAASRVKPLMTDRDEQVLVYTAREVGQGVSPNGPPSFDTTIDLVIDAGIVSPEEDDEIDDEVELDDRLDTLADEILAATLENAEWLVGIEAVQQIEIVKHPAGADGKPVIGGLRIAMQVSVGTVTYEPDLDTVLASVAARFRGETRPFGVDVNGDGAPDIEFEIDLPQA